jgi:murein DD-endopeptidase MepM/ murein hydrolase activator NlpD
VARLATVLPLVLVSVLSLAQEPPSTGAALVAPVPAPPDTDAAATAPSASPPTTLPPDTLVLGLDLPAGSSFGGLVERWGLDANAVRAAALPHHDLALLVPSHELSVELADGEAAPVAVRYAVDEDRLLWVRRAGETWSAGLEKVDYAVAEKEIVLDIRSSLWEAGTTAGLRPTDLARLAKIFEYELDFNTEIAAGAKLGLVGEVLSAEGHTDRLGTIHALRFVNGGKTHEMVRWVDTDGKETFFHPDGTSSIRAFLRSPLEFSRVTSGFNPRRYHPILKISRPHNGTDFGAPTGTPVRNVADGVVEFAGRSGGHGNFVKIRHEGGVYETSYSHLSAIAVRTGQKVRQGQLIGRVGSTGLATGPHLHFQMWKNGRYVDAMHQDMPRVRELPAHEKPAFDALVQQWLAKVPVPAPEKPTTTAER